MEFPISLPTVYYEHTAATPIVEFASTSECIARAVARPKNYVYTITVSLKNCAWSVEPLKAGCHPDGDYPYALAGCVAIAVVSWWTANFSTQASNRSAEIAPEVAQARARWLNHAAYKLMAEGGQYLEQVGALSLLASAHGMRLGRSAAFPTLLGANWAAAAHRHLERELPSSNRAGAVSLLLEMMGAAG